MVIIHGKASLLFQIQHPFPKVNSIYRYSPYCHTQNDSILQLMSSIRPWLFFPSLNYHSQAFCNLVTASNSTITWISWPQLGKRCLHEVQQVGECCHFKSAMVLIREGGSWLHYPPSCQVWCPRAQLNSIKRSPLLFCGLHLNNNFLHLILRTSTMVSHRETGTGAKLTL